MTMTTAQRLTLSELRTAVAQHPNHADAQALAEREATAAAIEHCTGNRWSEIRPQHIADSATTVDTPTGF